MEYFNRDQAFPPAAGFAELPEQAIPTSRKTKKWIQATADSLETIGVKQVRENQRERDYYLMADGKMSYSSIASVIPQLREIAQFREDVHIPSFLKHYDLLGMIVNVMVGWLSNMSDQYDVVGVDQEEVNQYLDTKTDKLVQYMAETMEMRLRQKMMANGIDPDYNDFQSEEEQQAYQQQIAQMRQAMTPPEIETFMNTRFKTAAAIWGAHTLEHDRFRFFMDEMDAEEFRHYLITGKVFRHFHVGYDYYRPETWHPLEVFYSKTMDLKFPQYGDYIGRIQFMTAGQIINRYGQHIKAEDKKRLLGGNNFLFGNDDDMKRPFSFKGWFNDQVIPFKGYEDYMSIVAAEDYTGVPMGVIKTWDSNGEEIKRPTFMPRYNNAYGYAGLNAEMMSDVPVRKDLYRVMEAYWVSYKLIYIVTYVDETGLVVQEIVTDELMKEFLEENGIKKESLTFMEGTKEPIVNTYFMEYVPEVRHVVKINGGSIKDKALYIDGEPIKHQIHGDGNLYDFVLPVSGYIGESVAQRIEPWQVLYNYACNQLYNLMEKEIGVFMLTDIAYVPTEYKNWGNVEETFSAIMDVAKSTGVMPVETSKQNAGYQTPFNQFSVYDMSLTKQMASRIEMAQFAKSQAFEMIGITPQALGQQGQYETAEGIRQGASSAQLQTQHIYDKFETYKRKTLDMHLAVAQSCQKEGQDLTVLTSRDDLTKAFISVTDDDLDLRQLGVMAIANSKKKKELEQLRQMLLQMNVGGSNILDLAGIVTSQSYAELMTVARKAVQYQEMVRQQEQEHQSQLAQQQSQAELERLQLEHQYKLEEIQKQGELAIRRTEVSAMGRAADSNADQESFDQIAQAADINLRETQINNDKEMKEKALELKQSLADKTFQQKAEELRLKAEQIKQRQREDDTKRFTSMINKN